MKSVNVIYKLKSKLIFKNGSEILKSLYNLANLYEELEEKDK